VGEQHESHLRWAQRTAIRFRNRAKHQCLFGTQVIRADKKFIYVDPGFKKIVKLSRKVMKLWDVVIQSTDPSPRLAPDDFRMGDRLILTIEELEGPFGDMVLAPDVPRKTDVREQARPGFRMLLGKVEHQEW
jgi:hypothetical protein